MPIVKPKWKKRLAATLCSMLLLCAALPITAFADDVHIATAYQPFMYFEKYNDGYWSDLGTPPHSVVETGQPAYCLQMSLESPYGDGYDATDGTQYYTPTIFERVETDPRPWLSGFPQEALMTIRRSTQLPMQYGIFLQRTEYRKCLTTSVTQETAVPSPDMKPCLHGAWSFWSMVVTRTRIIPSVFPIQI